VIAVPFALENTGAISWNYEFIIVAIVGNSTRCETSNQSMKGEAVRNIVIPRGPLKCGKYYSMEDEKKKEMKAEEASENNETTRL